VNLETVRFYEKEGLLPPASRTASGYRQLGEATVKRLEFVKRAKALGFSLDEIRELQGKMNRPKTKVAIPDLKHSKAAVLRSLGSPD
jgi:DNA-binding transcriptional MerR regulator